MDSVYFESSVILAVIAGEPNGPQIRSLLRELKAGKVRIYTSIITVQEISVLSFRRGTIAIDPLSKLHKLARIVGVTKEMALTAAKLEAQLKDLGKSPKEADQIAENRRRKWDCFHIAAAMCLKCTTVFSSDVDFLKRKTQLGITSLEFLKPVPQTAELDLRAAKPEKKDTDGESKDQPQPAGTTSVAASSPLPGSAQGSTPSEAGAQAAEGPKEGEAKAQRLSEGEA